MLVKFKGQAIMLFTNRAYTKHQDIHDQESFRKSTFLYSALQSPIQYCAVMASDSEILSLLNQNSLKHSKKIKDFLCNKFEFINLLWSLIFLKSNRCILEVQIEQLARDWEVKHMRI